LILSIICLTRVSGVIGMLVIYRTFQKKRSNIWSIQLALKL
jgi:hypothetical protein